MRSLEKIVQEVFCLGISEIHFPVGGDDGCAHGGSSGVGRGAEPTSVANGGVVSPAQAEQVAALLGVRVLDETASLDEEEKQTE
mgnify:CR=1 FL=1